MTTTTTEARPRGSRRQSLSWIVPAVFAIAACLLALSLSRATPDRQTVRIDNRTGVAVRVTVTAGPGDGRLAVGTIDPTSSTRIQEVIDQGDDWRFQLWSGPDRIGELRRSADELRAADWTLRIPADTAHAVPEHRK